MSPILNHTRVTAGQTEPERWLYLLHGIYGSGRNWGSLARRLVDERPGWGVILVDLRLHGGSQSFAPPHTVEACAEDVAQLQESLGIAATAILGHSFGGKVALLTAAAATPSPESLWVIDSTLTTGGPEGTAWEVIEIVRSLPDSFASRDEVADAFEARGYARGVGQWLAMNLEREGERFTWRLDWEGVEQMLRDYFATDVWQIVEDPPEGVELHVMKASRSQAVDDEVEARIRAAADRTGRVDLHVVEGGHWLNVDNPEGVLAVLLEELP